MLGSKPEGGSVNVLDLLLLAVLLMMWFVVSQVWNNPLPNIMFSVVILYFVMSIISKLTGALKFLKLSVPSWTISAMISIPIWAVFLYIIPSNTATSTVVASTLSTSITEGILSQFISHDNIVRLMQIVLFPFTESLLIIFLLSIFGGASSISDKSSKGLIAPLLIVAAFGAIIHITVASNLDTSGDISFDISIWQQFLSFFAFAVTGIIFGSTGVITSHIIKALLIFGSGGWWLGLFIMFILIDVFSILLNKKAGTGLQNPLKIFS